MALAGSYTLIVRVLLVVCVYCSVAEAITFQIGYFSAGRYRGEHGGAINLAIKRFQRAGSLRDHNFK